MRAGRHGGVTCAERGWMQIDSEALLEGSPRLGTRQMHDRISIRLIGDGGRIAQCGPEVAKKRAALLPNGQPCAWTGSHERKTPVPGPVRAGRKADAESGLYPSGESVATLPRDDGRHLEVRAFAHADARCIRGMDGLEQARERRSAGKPDDVR